MISRQAFLSKIKANEPYDVVIIGGGASGLGIAVDAVTRGLKTVLIEQYDFAKGTSSKSTKLLHGGVRYLAQGNVRLVSEALKERGLLAKNARHLFKNQEFIIPNYTWWGGYYYVLGLKFYDLLSRRLSLGASKLIPKKRVMQQLPTLKSDHLYAGVSYFDGQFDDARLALNLAQTAIQHGADIVNYMKATGILKDNSGVICGLKTKDSETDVTYEIRGRIFINATGIFTDKILKMQDPLHKKTVVPSQGIHLVLDRSFLGGDKAIMIPKTSDGRVLFIIPWYDKVIAGTTDTLIKKPKIEPAAQQREIDFILETINSHLSKKAQREDVLSVFSGLRPLAKPKGNDVKTKEVSRSHKIMVNGNLVSVVGGKWTTYRKMAEDVMDTVETTFELSCGPSKTAGLSIFGNISANDSIKEDHLAVYGSQRKKYEEFELTSAHFSECIHPGYAYTQGQVVWAVRFELARTVEDFLARRIRLLLLDARAAIEAAPLIAKIMAGELGKSTEWEQFQVETFTELANKYILD